MIVAVAQLIVAVRGRADDVRAPSFQTILNEVAAQMGVDPRALEAEYRRSVVVGVAAPDAPSSTSFVSAKVLGLGSAGQPETITQGIECRRISAGSETRASGSPGCTAL